jgi:hypothetical protein
MSESRDVIGRRYSTTTQNCRLFWIRTRAASARMIVFVSKSTTIDDGRDKKRRRNETGYCKTELTKLQSFSFSPSTPIPSLPRFSATPRPPPAPPSHPSSSSSHNTKSFSDTGGDNHSSVVAPVYAADPPPRARRREPGAGGKSDNLGPNTLVPVSVDDGVDGGESRV